jgi:cytochrome o ubiquinol oxidase subunit II
LNLLADAAGDYPGLSSHYSGDGFSDMRFMVHAVSPEDYQQWLGNTHNVPAVLDEAGYTDLARSSSNVSPKLYGKVDSMMLEHILQTATH